MSFHLVVSIGDRSMIFFFDFEIVEIGVLDGIPDAIIS